MLRDVQIAWEIRRERDEGWRGREGGLVRCKLLLLSRIAAGMGIPFPSEKPRDVRNATIKRFEEAAVLLSIRIRTPKSNASAASRFTAVYFVRGPAARPRR